MSRSGNPARRATATAARQLDRAYATIPDPGCKGLCTASCHSVVMTPAERERIRAETGIDMPLVYADLDVPCPALGDDGRCRVYRWRPAVCRLFGSVDDPLMRYPYGCRPAGGLMPAEEGRRVLAEVQKVV